jgi:hypothetical protein
VDEVHEKIEYLHLVERWIAVFAGGRRAREGENARTDDCADP